MYRSLWLPLAVAALGFWATLLPQVTYAAASSGEPQGDVLIAWPGWSIQQELGPLTGTVGIFQVWVSTDPGAFRDATVRASLIDANSLEVVRQTLVRVSRSYIPARHTIMFPKYVVPSRQQLLLQLGVNECEKCHVIYRLANPHDKLSNVMLNGVVDSGSGPLAFAHMKAGSGLRSAFDGEASSQIRLALAVGSVVLALLAHPRVLIWLRQLGITPWHLVRQLSAADRSLSRPDAKLAGTDPPSGLYRLLTAPWYPWLAAVVPVLHFLANNSLHFSLVEAVIPLAATLATVTCVVVVLRLALSNWHRSAAVTTAVVVVVFGYGHVESAIQGMVDDRLLFAFAVTLAASVIAVIARCGAGVSSWTRFLNLMTAVLLAFPAVSLIAGMAAASSQSTPNQEFETRTLFTSALQSELSSGSGDRPDIYYIILDSYARNDALVDLFGFDNSDFIRELEDRGFYVASKATSNYIYTIQSTASILNFQYLDDLGDRIPRTSDDLVNIARYHAAAATLKDLGYTYIHLDSGILSTEVSPLADHMVSFTQSGTLVHTGAASYSGTYADSSAPLLSSRFIRRLVRTTVFWPVLGEQFLVGENEPYEWWSPSRALQMFDYLSNPIEIESPKFVFAHIVKPHDPATFDRHGNQFDDHQGFDDYHDPSVPSAYVGQLIYVNKLVLDLIDNLLQESSEPPIIVIAGDHGRGISRDHRHSILGAFHLPDGGSDGLYPSISSVNHFRYIFDFYFDVKLGLLDDRLFEFAGDHYDFRK